MDKSKQRKLTQDLVDICIELDWVIGIPLTDTTEGLVVGTPQYVKTVCDKHYGKNNYEIISKESALEKAEEELVNSDNISDYDIVELTPEQFEQFMETGELPDEVRVLGGEKPPTLH